MAYTLSHRIAVRQRKLGKLAAQIGELEARRDVLFGELRELAGGNTREKLELERAKLDEQAAALKLIEDVLDESGREEVGS